MPGSWLQSSKAEQADLLRAVVLELFEEGLIYAYWAGWDDGPNASPDTVEHLDRERVDRYFVGKEYDTSMDDRFLWIGETPKGAEMWMSD